jgi:hypothetical protein
MLRWRYLDQAGRQVGQSEAFGERGEAEAWMGDAWTDLLAAGVEEVALVAEDEDRILYRMGLREE